MKFIKIFLMPLVVICFLVSLKAQAAHQLYADIDGITLPYGTKFELTLANDVTTRQAVVGDMFQAYLNKDIYINNKLILPSKTIFRGRVSQIKYSRALSRPAALYLTIDHLVTKKGVQLPINSGVSSSFEYVLKSDGAITTDGNYFKAVAKHTKEAASIVPRTVKWGTTSSDDLFVGAKILFVPVAVAGGCIACVGSTVYNAIADLFRHGDEIIIKRDTKFEIILLAPLEIPS